MRERPYDISLAKPAQVRVWKTAGWFYRRNRHYSAHTKICIQHTDDRSPLGLGSFIPDILPILKDEKINKLKLKLLTCLLPSKPFNKIIYKFINNNRNSIVRLGARQQIFRNDLLLKTSNRTTDNFYCLP